MVALYLHTSYSELKSPFPVFVPNHYTEIINYVECCWKAAQGSDHWLYKMEFIDKLGEKEENIWNKFTLYTTLEVGIIISTLNEKMWETGAYRKAM